MSNRRTSHGDPRPQPRPVETAEPSRTTADAAAQRPSAPLADDIWDVFELDEDTIEPEPERGDFWGELDDDDETI